MAKVESFPDLDTLITTGQVGAKMKFTNNDGVIELEGGFPEKMSLKQAFRYSVEKHEFILEELLAGRVVTDDGNCNTCALCFYTEEIQDRCWEMTCSCFACPILHKTGERGCEDTPYEKMEEDRRQDGSFRVPNVRRQIKFLKALEVDYA